MLLIGLALLFCVGWIQLFCTNGACDCESSASHTLDDYKKMFNDYIADQVLLFLILTLLLLLLHKLLFILALGFCILCFMFVYSVWPERPHFVPYALDSLVKMFPP